MQIKHLILLLYELVFIINNFGLLKLIEVLFQHLIQMYNQLGILIIHKYAYTHFNKCSYKPVSGKL